MHVNGYTFPGRTDYNDIKNKQIINHIIRVGM